MKPLSDDASSSLSMMSAMLIAFLQVGEPRRKVDVLREAAQGGLGLGSGGKAARGQQVRARQCSTACRDIYKQQRAVV